MKDVGAILRAVIEVGVGAIFAVVNVIAAGIFGVATVIRQMRLREDKFLKLSADFLQLREAAKVGGVQLGFVFFFGQLFVEPTVLFVFQIDAAETIGAVITVEKKGAVGAVLTFGHEKTAVTLLAVGAFVAEFGFHGVEDVHGVVAVVGKFGVTTIFIHASGKNHVAIFEIHHSIGIFAVFEGAKCQFVRAWNLFLQVVELFEKGAG